MIDARNVTKRYNRVLANNQVSVRVESGQLGVLLGPNGAGKSTLIKSICGLLRFDGDISIAQFENHTPEAKRLLGYVPEFPALYPMLTVWEHLEFIARAYRLTGWQPWAEELITRFELDDKRLKLGRELSKGMQQKVSVCCAFLPRPAAVILDEPLVGLDPHGIRELQSLLLEQRDAGTALLVSTHMIESVEADWDTCFIMMSGRLVRTVQRSQLAPGESLKEIFFAITEGEQARS
jgi:ABC-type multidrug transport system ATPase subunit